MTRMRTSSPSSPSSPSRRLTRRLVPGLAVLALLGAGLPATGTAAEQATPVAAPSAPQPTPAGDDLSLLDVAAEAQVITADPLGEPTAGDTTRPRLGLSADAARAAREAGDDGTVAVIVEVAGGADADTLARDAEHAALRAARAGREEAPAGATEAAVEAGGHEAGERARAAFVVDTLQDSGAEQRERVTSDLADLGATGVRDLWIVGAVAAEVDAAALPALADHPDVLQVGLDAEISLPDPPAPLDETPPLLPEWGLEAVQAPRTWGEFGDRGDGVTVAVLDTGVAADHPALAPSYRGRDGDHSDSWYVATGENYPEPGDGNGHGTHVTGSVAGGAPGEVVGVAPEADWIGVKILRDNGSGALSGILDGMQWVLAPGGDPAAAPDIANNSWGITGGGDDTFWDAVSAWRSAGILPVVSAGNAGPLPSTLGSPGDYPHSFTVAATDEDDVVASFSSRGPAVWGGQEITTPDISAPGHEVRSAWPADLGDGSGYRTISGTSMAAPHVSGVAALVASANPSLGVDALEQVLRDTARVEDHMGEVPNDSYGLGIADSYAGVTAAAHSSVLRGVVSGPDGPVEARVTVLDADPVVEVGSDPQSGLYETHLPETASTVEISAFGYVTEQREIDPRRGRVVVLDVALEAAPVSPVSGTVTAEGEPVVAAKVSLVDRTDVLTYTDADGGYVLDLPHGEHRVRIQAAGHTPVTETLTVDGAQTWDVALSPLAQEGADQWPQYRGSPARLGLSDSSVTIEGFGPLWQAAVSPVQFGSPVIDSDTVYLSSLSGVVSAMDRWTGEPRWSLDVGTSLNGTPAVADGVVYTARGTTPGLVALRAVDGTVVWESDLGGQVAMFGAPTVVGDTVYLATGPGGPGSLVALDVATGEQRWSTLVGSDVFFGPAVGEGVAVVAGNGDGVVTAVDVGTGEVLWTHEDAEGSITMPTIADGLVFLGTTTDEDVTSGSVYALDLFTGEQVWRVDGQGDTQGGGGVVYDDVLIVPSHSAGAVVAYDRATGERVWHHFVGTAVTSSVAVTEGGLVFGGSQDGRAWALDASSGRLLWEQDLPAAVVSATAVADGLVVVAARDGSVHAFTAGGSVSGVVTGSDGEGPIEAEVSLEPGGPTTSSDPQTGAYSLSAPVGDYEIVARAYGYGEVRTPAALSALEPLVVDLTLEPVGVGAVSGVVTDAGGDPLQGAVATLPGTPLPPLTTGADGSFAWDEVAAGPRDLQVSLPGFVTDVREIEVPSDGTAEVTVALEPYDLAVVADQDGRITEVLTEAGWSVDTISFEQAEGTVEAYSALVLGGTAEDRADADLARLAGIVEQAQDAGVGVVALDQWAPSYGSVEAFLEATGSPAVLGSEFSNRGAVRLDQVIEHPVTAGLEPDGATPYLTGGSHAWLEGWDGLALARLASDRDGPQGTAVGYDRLGLSTPLVLLTASAATPWAGPGDTWEPAATPLLVDSVTHALEAEFGGVDVSVQTLDGPVDGGLIRVVEGETSQSEAVVDGAARLILTPGTHTLRLQAAGVEAEDAVVEVAAGEEVSVTLDATPSATGAIAGTVTEGPGGEPLAGVTVSVRESGLDPVVTGADGGYEVTGVPEGTYTVTASAEGWSGTGVDDVVVTAGATTTLDLELTAVPRVAVLGEFDGQLTTWLTEQGVPATATDWSVVEDLDAYDVVVLNRPEEVGRSEFLAHLEAFDEAGVGVVVTATNSAFSTPGLEMLVEYLGDPAGWEDLGGFGDPPITLTPVGEHPITAGLGEGPLALVNGGAEAPWFVEPTGLVVGEVGTVDEEPAGPGLVVDVRTPDSVLVLVSGLASSVRNQPATTWGEDGGALFLNTLRYAAEPGLTQVTGTVLDAAGAPVPGTSVAVQGRSWTADVDVEGGFRLGLPDGEHTLVVSAPGHLTTEVAVVADGTGQELAIVLEPAPGGAVTGTVTSEDDAGAGAGSVPAADGDPVEGAVVRLTGTSIETTTAADGTFTLPQVGAGEQELEVEAEGHVRTLVPVDVGDEGAQVDIAIRVTPRVGVVDDSSSGSTAGRTAEFLTDWGYEPVAVDWGDAEEIADLDAVVVNVDGPGDPGRAGLDEFSEAVNRGSVPVVWLGNYARGGIRYLGTHYGELTWGQASMDGSVTGTLTADHLLTEGLPETFAVTEPNRFHGWFTDYPGETVATVASGTDGDLGSLVAHRGRTADTVDVLLSTSASSNYGAHGTRQSEALYFSPETTRLLVNALAFAEGQEHESGAEALGTVRDGTGAPLDALVTVVETGRTAPARTGDGTFLVALDPGTWTLEVSRFGYATQQVQVEVAAGESARPEVTLVQSPGAALTGIVDASDSTPSAGASVRVLGTDLATTTDDDGAFTFPHVPEGDWVVRVDAGDGEPGRSRYLGVEIPDLPEGEAVEVEVTLGAAASALVVADRASGGIAPFLVEHGWQAEAVAWSAIPGIDLAGAGHDVVVVNGAGVDAEDAVFTGLVEHAAAHDVPMVFASQFNTGSIDDLQETLGDPAEVDQGFEPDAMGYRVTAEHPMLTGFAVGEDITLLTNPGTNQQYADFTGYSGEVLAQVVAPDTGEVFGDGLAYRFATPSSVHVLLGSLSAGAYGAPDSRWTTDASRVYLGALDWALTATQSEVQGTVTGPDGPLADAVVTASGRTTTSDADGAYRLGVAPGEVSVEASAPGFVTGEESVTVPEGESVQVDLALEPLPASSLQVVVEDADGAEVPDAQVVVSGPIEVDGITDVDGVAAFTDLPVGTYTVGVEADGFLPASVEVEVGEEPATITLTPTPIDVGVLGDHEGTLTDFLLEEGEAAQEVAWTEVVEPGAIDRYEVLVLNGGDPSSRQVRAVVQAADAAGVSLLVSGTYGVDRGGVRLLERADQGVVVGGQGYGEGSVGLSGSGRHPLFRGVDLGRVLAPDGYWSWISESPGTALGGLVIDGENLGPAVTMEVQGRHHGTLLIGFTAVTEHSGPGRGWNDSTDALVLNAVDYLRDLDAQGPRPRSSVSEAASGSWLTDLVGAAES